MPTILVYLIGLVSARHLNGQQGTVSGRTMNLKGEIRFSVVGTGFNVSVRVQNLTCSSTCDEDILSGLLLQGGTPIIALLTNLSGSFMTDMGKNVLISVQSIRGMNDQQRRQLLLNCGHVLNLSPVPVQEPGWSEVQRNLQLECASAMKYFGLNGLASQYARMVLSTDPANASALEFVRK